jgi:host factor-I protein
MEVKKEASVQAIEPQFLSLAQAKGIKLRIGQMNKTEHEGVIRDIGRYEINVDENGKIVTLLKQEISYLSASQPVISIPAPSPTQTAAEQQETPGEPAGGRPNIQQEFLDKAIRENQTLTLFLMSGQRIRATVEAYDNFTLLVKEGGNQHLYYKHSITTINR